MRLMATPPPGMIRLAIIELDTVTNGQKRRAKSIMRGDDPALPFGDHVHLGFVDTPESTEVGSAGFSLTVRPPDGPPTTLKAEDVIPLAKEGRYGLRFTPLN